MEGTHKHVAVLVFPFASHIGSLLNVIRGLSQAAPDVKFTFFNTATSNASLFPQGKAQGNITPHNVWDGLPEDYKFSGNPEEPMELFLEATPKNYRSALIESGTRFSCLLTDAFIWFGAHLAEELCVPWIPCWTSGPRGLFIHLHAEEIRQRIGTNGHEDKALDFFPDFSAIRALDLPLGFLTASRDHPIQVLLKKVEIYLRRTPILVAISFEELEPIVTGMLKSTFETYLDVGPLPLTCPPPSSGHDEHGCLEWLDKQKPASVAYIAFGTVTKPPPSELAAIAAALEETRTPFLWSFRGNAEEHLPHGFVERTESYGKLVPWAPQFKVVAHPSVGVFFSHCGWNSLSEGVVGGVPMICRPFFADQRLNFRTAETMWGTCLGIDGGKLTQDGIVKALELIFTSEEGKKMREKTGALKELAFKATQPGGSSSQNWKTLAEIITGKSIDNPSNSTSCI